MIHAGTAHFRAQILKDHPRFLQRACALVVLLEHGVQTKRNLCQVIGRLRRSESQKVAGLGAIAETFSNSMAFFRTASFFWKPMDNSWNFWSPKFCWILGFISNARWKTSNPSTSLLCWLFTSRSWCTWLRLGGTFLSAIWQPTYHQRKEASLSLPQHQDLRMILLCDCVEVQLKFTMTNSMRLVAETQVWELIAEAHERYSDKKVVQPSLTWYFKLWSPHICTENGQNYEQSSVLNLSAWLILQTPSESVHHRTGPLKSAMDGLTEALLEKAVGRGSEMAVQIASLRFEDLAFYGFLNMS